MKPSKNILFTFLFGLVFFSGFSQSIDFTAKTLNGCAPILIEFEATGAPDSSVYYWNFGNGPETGGRTMVKVFTQVGYYDVSLEVRYPDGTLHGPVSKNDYISIGKKVTPVISISPDTLVCNKPYTFTLTDLTSNAIDRQWIIDDSIILADRSQQVIYTFNTAGYKSIAIKTYDQYGCESYEELRDIIQIDTAVNVDFYARMTETGSGMTANFTHLITENKGLVSSYLWSFPGGSPSSASTEVPPLVTYAGLSTPQDVTLTVTTKNGCVFTYTKPGLIQKYYSKSKTDYCYGEPAVFFNLGNDATKTVINYKSQQYYYYVKGTQPNEVKNYFFNLGARDVTFVIEYKNSTATDELLVPAMFNVLHPRADFISNDRMQCAVNSKVNFSALNTPPSGSTTYTWRFYDSDGQELTGSPVGPSLSSTASFTFDTMGYYSVSLVMSNSNGCTDTMVKPSYVSIFKPAGILYSDDTVVCMGDIVKVNGYYTPGVGANAFNANYVVRHTDSTNVVYTRSGNSVSFIPGMPGKYDLSYIVSNGCEDRIDRQGMITVNGVMAEIKADDATGCSGMTTRLSAVILAKYPATPFNILSYKWEVFPQSGAVISNPASPNTNVTFTQLGCYRAVLTISGSGGCTSVVQESDIVCIGSFPDFTIADIGCVNAPYKVVNTTTGKSSSRKWIVSPAANIFPSDTAFEPKISFPLTGCYLVKLVTGLTSPDGSVCYDTVEKQICIQSTVAGFYSNDTVNYCSP
ncbi:MAG: PKD domain-containing protein, partial [Bacteroidota bacterium]|nr:PKD domain-containing protein [Bacteroidota bacterium]